VGKGSCIGRERLVFAVIVLSTGCGICEVKRSDGSEGLIAGVDFGKVFAKEDVEIKERSLNIKSFECSHLLLVDGKKATVNIGVYRTICDAKERFGQVVSRISIGGKAVAVGDEGLIYPCRTVVRFRRRNVCVYVAGGTEEVCGRLVEVLEKYLTKEDSLVPSVPSADVTEIKLPARIGAGERIETIVVQREAEDGGQIVYLGPRVRFEASRRGKSDLVVSWDAPKAPGPYTKQLIIANRRNVVVRKEVSFEVKERSSKEPE